MKLLILNVPFLTNGVKKLICMMKISVFLIFCFSLQLFAANSYSQSARLTLHMNNVKIKDVLMQIESQSEFYFLYNGKLVDVDKTVSVNVNNLQITDVLNQLFANKDVAVKVVDRQIVLLPSSMQTDFNAAVTQGISITGTIKDNTGEPMPGVNVTVKGTITGTVSDFNGRYTIAVPNRDAVLVFSFVGYVTQELAVGDMKVIDITLNEDTRQIEEVVVIGYGTQKKGEVASAISTVKSANFLEGTSTADAAQLIRGMVAGLTIVSPDANPTSTSQIMLRGITTLKASASPLVLIDGIPGDLNTVSPQDIEQIDVLKDGSAAAIYGTRGTNGVILITTKNAKGEMPTTVDVNAYLSMQKITKRLPFMSAEQYRELVKLNKPGAQDDGVSTNWLDEVMQTPFTQIYSINLKGGSRNTNYVASFEYRSINGLIQRTDNQMVFPRIEVTHRMFDGKLKLNGSVYGYKQTYFSGSDGGSYNSAVYRNALTFNPTTPLKDANGKWSESPSKTDYFNPMALLWEVEGENQATNLRAFGAATFSPIAGLDIKYLIATRVYNQVRGYYETKQHISTVKDNKNGYASRGTTRSIEDISELTIQYNKTVANDHTFTVLGGYSWLKDNYQNYYMQNYNFPSDDYTYNNMGQGQALKDGRATEVSEQKENKLIGYFGRLNYNFKGKYMLAASIRYEGSTKFGANHKWGTFPAISAAWNIKGENFMESFSTLSSLKLRAGYGVTGTEPTEPYMSLNELEMGDYIYYNGAWIKAIRPKANPNPDLRWEKKEEANIGVDFGFANDRIYGSIDYYNRKTKDLLWDYTVPSPPYLFSSMVANAGSMRNQGIEVSLTGVVIQNNDWQWTTSVNYSFNKNELLSLSNDKFISSGYSDQGDTGEPIQQKTHRIKEGQPIGNFWGFKSVDIDDTGHWIIEGEDGKPKPVAQQQPTDKKVLGNGLPKHYLNWNNTVSYRNFDLTVTMRGAFGFQVMNMAEMQYSVPVMLSRGNIFEHSYDKIYGKVPLADNQELQYVSYYIENGDYWKIDNVTLGYTLNLNKSWIKRFRVYGTISNLAVITGYKGIDPEVSISGLTPGIDNKNRYPSARTFTIGASFTF